MDRYHIDFFWTSLISSSCQSCHPISSLPRIEMLQSISFARPSSCQLSSTTRQRQVLETASEAAHLYKEDRISLYEPPYDRGSLPEGRCDGGGYSSFGDSLISNVTPETAGCIRLVQSLSRHRYYGQNPDSPVLM